MSRKSENVTAEDGEVNNTLPATSQENRVTNVTVSSGKGEREVNDIMKIGTNKRRGPIVALMGHSDSEKLSKDQSSELPPPSLVCTLKSFHQTDKKTMTL